MWVSIEDNTPVRSPKTRCPGLPLPGVLLLAVTISNDPVSTDKGTGRGTLAAWDGQRGGTLRGKR